jgi:hypothetical protein
MPDIHTGEPRPPHAPHRGTWPAGVPDTDPAAKPEPPPGEGPVLEYFKRSHRESLLYALAGAVILAVGGTIISRGLSWIGHWFYWALILATALTFFVLGQVEVFAAGAQWFKFKKKWVRTYELTEVKLKARGPGWWHLVLADRHNHRVTVPLNNLVQNRELWDLVYNGILHSVHKNQVTTNRAARKLLRLPDPAK